MGPVVPDLAEPIRTAILSNTAVVALLATYLGSPTVFTRRPVPPDAPYPLILVSGNIIMDNFDGVADTRPVFTRDVAIYSTNENAENYRVVETIAGIIYAMFDKVHNVIDVENNGWNLVSIRCRGPIVAPADDDLHVGRIVTMQIQLGNPASG